MRTPQTLSHLFCSWRFVGFLPLDGKTTVVAAASQSRVALKLLKWKRVCHSHYVRLSLVAATAFSPSHPPFPSHSGYPSLFSHFSLCRGDSFAHLGFAESRIDQGCLSALPMTTICKTLKRTTARVRVRIDFQSRVRFTSRRVVSILVNFCLAPCHARRELLCPKIAIVSSVLSIFKRNK